MTGSAIFFLVAAIALAILMPYLVIRDIKKGKKKSEIFISHIVILVVFLVAIAEVLKFFISTQSMQYFNQALFLFIILLIVVPLILMQVFTIKSDIKKWNDPSAYQREWAYKYRYILLAFFSFIFIGALYRFYVIYKILFI